MKPGFSFFFADERKRERETDDIMSVRKTRKVGVAKHRESCYYIQPQWQRTHALKAIENFTSLLITRTV